MTCMRVGTESLFLNFGLRMACVFMLGLLKLEKLSESCGMLVSSLPDSEWSGSLSLIFFKYFRVISAQFYPLAEDLSVMFIEDTLLLLILALSVICLAKKS